MIPKAIHEYPLFHDLHVSNSDLVPLIDRQIRQMKEEGQFDEIWSPCLKSVKCD